MSLNTYIDSVKYILDNYNVISNEKTYSDSIGPLIHNCSLIQNLLDSEYYQIRNTDNYFHYPEFIEFLKTNKLSSDPTKKTLITFWMHPRNAKKDISNYKTHFFDILFKDVNILNKIWLR